MAVWGCRWPRDPARSREPAPPWLKGPLGPGEPDRLTYVLCLRDPGAGDGLIGTDLVGVIQLLEGGVLRGFQELPWGEGWGRVSTMVAGPQRGLPTTFARLPSSLRNSLALLPSKFPHSPHILPMCFFSTRTWRGQAPPSGGRGGAQDSQGPRTPRKLLTPAPGAQSTPHGRVLAPCHPRVCPPGSSQGTSIRARWRELSQQKAQAPGRAQGPNPQEGSSTAQSPDASSP